MRPAQSPRHRQTVWRWPRQSQRCHCSRPRANRDRLRMKKELSSNHLCYLIQKEGGFGGIFMCRFVSLTPLSVPAVIAATVVKVAKTAVPGQSVHDSSRADGMHKCRLPIRCQQRDSLTVLQVRNFTHCSTISL